MNQIRPKTIFRKLPYTSLYSFIHTPFKMVFRQHKNRDTFQQNIHCKISIKKFICRLLPDRNHPCETSRHYQSANAQQINKPLFPSLDLNIVQIIPTYKISNKTYCKMKIEIIQNPADYSPPLSKVKENSITSCGSKNVNIKDKIKKYRVNSKEPTIFCKKGTIIYKPMIINKNHIW